MTTDNDAPSGAPFVNLCALGETDRAGKIICKFHTLDELYCGYINLDPDDKENQKKCHKFIPRGIRK